MTARRKERFKYVIGTAGAYKIQLFINHPPRCICASCRKRRSPDGWDVELPIRIQRRSIFPNSMADSFAYATRVKRDEEARLNRDVLEAEKHGAAVGNKVSVGQLCDAYRAYQKQEGKRYDRDRYRIDEIEGILGRNTDASRVGKSEYKEFKKHFEDRGLSPASILRITNTLLAIFNHGLRDEDLNFETHSLTNLKRPRVRTKTKPVIFTMRQVDILLGPAMEEYERRQAAQLRAVEKSGKDKSLSQVSFAPMRGFCLIGYLTLMRPNNNRNLDWSQITFGPGNDDGNFRLDRHKNTDKGVNVEGPLHPMLVKYLRSIMPSEKPAGPIHPNLRTGKPFATFETQWRGLVRIANNLLPPDEQLTGRRAHFYTWRHTGASRMAGHGVDPVKICRMMGDTSLTTVMKHYFDSTIEEMAASIQGWQPFRFSDGNEKPESVPN